MSVLPANVSSAIRPSFSQSEHWTGSVEIHSFVKRWRKIEVLLNEISYKPWIAEHRHNTSTKGWVNSAVQSRLVESLSNQETFCISMCIFKVLAVNRHNSALPVFGTVTSRETLWQRPREVIQWEGCDGERGNWLTLSTMGNAGWTNSTTF